MADGPHGVVVVFQVLHLGLEGFFGDGGIYVFGAYLVVVEQGDVVALGAVEVIGEVCQGGVVVDAVGVDGEAVGAGYVVFAGFGAAGKQVI